MQIVYLLLKHFRTYHILKGIYATYHFKFVQSYSFRCPHLSPPSNFGDKHYLPAVYYVCSRLNNAYIKFHFNQKTSVFFKSYISFNNSQPPTN